MRRGGDQFKGGANSSKSQNPYLKDESYYKKTKETEGIAKRRKTGDQTTEEINNKNNQMVNN